MHGQFVWYELSTPDVESATQFYPRFTGWGTQPFDKDYMMFTTGGVPVAGIYRLTDELRQQGVPPNWMPYVEADDIDATATKAKSLGGTVVAGPGDIPNVGRFAVIRDPQGATFGIYKSNGPSGAWDGTNIVGRFSWHELMTTDYEKAFEFYRALFGWDQVDEMDMGGGQTYSLYGKGKAMYGGMFNRFGDMENMPPFWLVYIHVPDVGKALASAVKAGGAVHRPQLDIPGGSIAILGDPQGAGFALHHANAQPQAQAASKKTAKTATKARGKKKAAAKRSASARRPAKVAKKAAKTARTAPKRATKGKASTKRATSRGKATSKAAARKQKSAARAKKR